MWENVRNSLAKLCIWLLLSFFITYVFMLWIFSVIFWNTRIQFLDFRYQLVSLLEKAVAPHSSTPAWKIPWTAEPGRLQSMGSLSVGHDWVTSLSLFTFTHWRRKWQPIPVFLPGESQGQGSLVGFCLWGHTELDMTEAT